MGLKTITGQSQQFLVYFKLFKSRFLDVTQEIRGLPLKTPVLGAE
jgi:hypothetical protein